MWSCKCSHEYLSHRERWAWRPWGTCKVLLCPNLLEISKTLVRRLKKQKGTKPFNHNSNAGAPIARARSIWDTSLGGMFGMPVVDMISCNLKLFYKASLVRTSTRWRQGWEWRVVVYDCLFLYRWSYSWAVKDAQRLPHLYIGQSAEIFFAIWITLRGVPISDHEE